MDVKLVILVKMLTVVCVCVISLRHFVDPHVKSEFINWPPAGNHRDNIVQCHINGGFPHNYYKSIISQCTIFDVFTDLEESFSFLAPH